MTGAAAQRAYRQAHPDYAEHGRQLVKARWRALTELSRRHAAEYEQLYRAELAAAGVELRRPGRPPGRRPRLDP